MTYAIGGPAYRRGTPAAREAQPHGSSSAEVHQKCLRRCAKETKNGCLNESKEHLTL